MRIRRMGWMTIAVTASLAITGFLLLISGVTAFRLVGARAIYELNSRIEESFVAPAEVYAPGDDDAVLISTTDGYIDVVAADVDEVTVVTVRTGRGPDEASAIASAEAVEPGVEYEDGTLRLTWSPAEDAIPHVRVSWHVTVPLGTRLSANSKYGDVDTRGALGATDLISRAGDVQADGVRGGLVINAGFGDVEAIDVRGGLAVTSTNGEIKLRNIDAGRDAVFAETEFGDVNANDMQAASITLMSRAGSVKARDIEAQGDVRIDSGFGDVTLERSAAGGLSIETRSGEVRLVDLELNGTLEAMSAFGDIEIIGVRDAQPVVKANSGSILFSGSLAPNTDALFETDFGDVELRLPASSAFDVEFESGFGRVTSDLPVLTSGELGGSTGNGQISGRLGEGGPKLRAHSKSGSIRLLALEVEG